MIVPFPLPGNFTYSLAMHSMPFEPQPLEEDVWDRKAVAFWFVDGDSIKPLGLAAVVSNGFLTCNHVHQAIQVSWASGKKVYVAVVHREVKSVLDDSIQTSFCSLPQRSQQSGIPSIARFYHSVVAGKVFAACGVKSGGKVSFKTVFRRGWRFLP